MFFHHPGLFLLRICPRLLVFWVQMPGEGVTHLVHSPLSILPSSLPFLVLSDFLNPCSWEMQNQTSDTWVGDYLKSHDWLLCTNYLEGLGVGARIEMITEQLKRDLFLFLLLPCHVQMSVGFLSACVWLRTLLRWHLVVWRAKCCACISAGNFAVESQEDHLHFIGTRLSIAF